MLDTATAARMLHEVIARWRTLSGPDRWRGVADTLERLLAGLPPQTSPARVVR
jgi:hypothetical protein